MGGGGSFTGPLDFRAKLRGRVQQHVIGKLYYTGVGGFWRVLQETRPGFQVRLLNRLMRSDFNFLWAMECPCAAASVYQRAASVLFL